MIRTIGTLFFLALGTLCYAADDSQEPPLQYTLKIDGKGHDMVLDTPVRIQGTFTNPEVTLAAAPTRQFNAGGITFNYPAPFTWEADIQSSEEKYWTLSGNDFKIMYFVQPESLSVDDYAEAMAKQTGKENTRISNTERTLGTCKCKGRLLKLILAGIELTMEVYALPAQTGSRLLILQDSPPENKTNSKEGGIVLDMLARTFKETTPSSPASTGQ